MKNIQTFEKYKENLSPIQFKTVKDDDGDRTTIELYVGDIYVGNVIYEIITNAYWYFDNDFSEEEYDVMFPDDILVRIEHIKVEDQFKGKKYGQLLMTECIRQIRKLKIKKAYLNASPMDSLGLRLTQLVNFYEKFGFKILLQEGHNTQMIADL